MKTGEKKQTGTKGVTTAAKAARPGSGQVRGKAASRAAGGRPAAAGLTKRYLKSRPVCKVTFRLPGEAAAGAGSVVVVGEFNNWDKRVNPMKRLKSGAFSATIDLPAGRAYRFRYLIDDARWENDWQADDYVPNPYGGDDSVVEV
ncbi:MAG TPA: hypothetical protein ENJ37_10910 [Deltaproteobacteria bacterium]|nr:hypothetical protein [Deltaproteobacteria bacterium]